MARDHNAENLGPVAQVPRLYLFRRPDRARSDTGPDPLATDPRVEWIERQVETRVFPEGQ